MSSILRWARHARAAWWAAGAAVDRARARARPWRCGWVTAHTLEPHAVRQTLGHLGPALDMRVSNNARWMNAHGPSAWHEIYDPRRRYDVVVFFKAMDARCQEEARRVQVGGGRVVFDANVNYYDVWGEYDVPGTQPTPEQQRDARAMTALADHVVADSTYLLGVVRAHNAHATWIPDNVDPRVFQGRRRHRETSPVRLVWSGVAKKAAHLLSIRDVLAGLRDVELVLVTDGEPAGLAALRQAIPCRIVPYSDRRYARTLVECDVIVSPKRLVNAYEMAHTEYKITCGMAVGLPAVASPQASYVEAIGYADGGIIADGADEWRAALERLIGDVALRADKGERAWRTVAERYGTPVVAPRYQAVVGPPT